MKTENIPFLLLNILGESKKIIVELNGPSAVF